MSFFYFENSRTGLNLWELIENKILLKFTEWMSRLKLFINKTCFKVDVIGDDYQVIKVGKFSIEVQVILCLISEESTKRVAFMPMFHIWYSRENWSTIKLNLLLGKSRMKILVGVEAVRLYT